MDGFIFEPIFNLITFLIAVIPGHNFGVALILFTVVTRFILYPLIKKQLLLIKKQKQLQPEVQKIKKTNKGNRQQEMMEVRALYKENNFNPFAVLGYLLIQLPILIGLYQVINRVATDSHSLVEDSYSFIQDLPWLEELAEDPDVFDPSLFGLVNLTREAVDNPGLIYESEQIAGPLETTDDVDEEPFVSQSGHNLSLHYDDENKLVDVSSSKINALEYTIVSDADDCSRDKSDQAGEFKGVQNNQIEIKENDTEDKAYVCVRGNGNMELYIGALLVVLAAALAQYFTSKQMMIDSGGPKKKSLRQIFKEQAEGKEVEQSEISAATSRTFVYIMPALIFFISLGWFAALPFYWFVSGIMQYFQQKKINSQEKGGMVKAVVDSQDVVATVEKRLNAKQKKEQARQTKSVYSPGKKRPVKRVTATSKTIKKKRDKKG